MPSTTMHPTVHGFPYNRRATAAQRAGNHQLELNILLEGVQRHADTPYTYDRSATLLERAHRYEEALQVCDRWFDLPQRTRMSGQVTEAKIRQRRTKLLRQLGMEPAAQPANDAA